MGHVSPVGTCNYRYLSPHLPSPTVPAPFSLVGVREQRTGSLQGLAFCPHLVDSLRLVFANRLF